MYRTGRLGFFFSPAEKTEVLKLAKAEGGLSHAAFVKRLIKSDAQQHGLWSLIIEPDEIDKGQPADISGSRSTPVRDRDGREYRVCQ